METLALIIAVGSILAGIWFIIQVAIRPLKESLIEMSKDINERFKDVMEEGKKKADRETGLILYGILVREFVSFKKRNRPILKAMESYLKTHKVTIEYNGNPQIGDLSYLVKLEDKEFIIAMKKLLEDE